MILGLNAVLTAVWQFSTIPPDWTEKVDSPPILKSEREPLVLKHLLRCHVVPRPGEDY